MQPDTTDVGALASFVVPVPVPVHDLDVTVRSCEVVFQKVRP